jgi:hypothetical protein
MRMKSLNHFYVLTGSRTFRQRCYILAAIVDGISATIVMGWIAWLIIVRPSEAEGLAGYSERHVFGFLVRYLSLNDEAVLNGLMIGLMLASALTVIMLGWLWHRRLTHILPSPDITPPADDHDQVKSM